MADILWILWLLLCATLDTMLMDLIQVLVKCQEPGINKLPFVTKVGKSIHYIKPFKILCFTTKNYKLFVKIYLAVTCAELTLSNGGITYSQPKVNGRYPVNTKATFSCNSRYTRDGSNSSTCNTLGEWDQQTPACNLSINIL